MQRSYLFLSISLVILSALLLIACGTQQVQPEGTKSLEAIAATANAENTFSVEQSAPISQLAVEVEITAEGVKPVGVSIIHAPAQFTRGLENDFTIRVQAGDEVVTEYAIPDPRLVEIEGQEKSILPSAQIFVYVPLTEGLTELQIEPLPGESQAEFAPTTDSIDLIPLLQQACTKQPEFAECQEVLQQK